MPKCEICGEELVESTVTTLKCQAPERHGAGEPKIGSAALLCPLKQGAIWVYVTADGGGVKGIATKVAGAPEPDGATDPTGFAGYDPLAEKSYSVEIAVPEELADKYRAPKRSKIDKVLVRPGEITSVEFPLERVAPLKVTVRRPEAFPGKPEIKLTATSSEFEPPKDPVEGTLGKTFPRLRRSTYTATVALNGEQKKRYRVVASSKDWSHDPSRDDNEVTFDIVPLKLVRLEVQDATDTDDAARFWCAASTTKKVRVTAITEPNEAVAWSQLAWSVGTPTDENSAVLVDIDAVKDIPVKATLDVDKSVTIEVCDLVSYDCALPLKASKHKTYFSDVLTRLKAKTDPDKTEVWSRLVWSEGTVQSSKNECDVVRKPVGARVVKVSLGTKSIEIPLNVCQWPRLEIAKVIFECHEVLNDGETDIGNPFDKQWHEGRDEPAIGKKAADTQSPICFTQGKKIKLSAVFKVVEKATDDEKVSVKGTFDFGHVTADVDVGAGATTATMASTESSAPLPDKVDCQDTWKIDWTAVLDDQSTWVGAKSSKHILYVTLGDPQGPAYLTLLDISCRAAKGESTETELVKKSFGPFKSHLGDNNGMPRKGDGKKMSYYLTGVNTAADDTTYTTKGILGSPAATGRCGGWAQLLVDMWKLHGVVAGKRWFVRALKADFHDGSLRFLVKNCDFSSLPTWSGPYTHLGDGSIKQDGVPGQGKTNPQFDFSDHVVVKHGGKLYDPSYGIGPYDTDKAYLKDALDGLGKYGSQTPFTHTDGTPQHIPQGCVPWNKGFAQYTIRRLTFDEFAAKFGVTGTQLLAMTTTLKTTRLTSADVVPGDVIDFVYGTIFPRPMPLVEVTLASIAAAHGKSEDEIFDHSDNSTVKSSRGTTAGLLQGDVIKVSHNLVSDGVWVIGHDI